MTLLSRKQGILLTFRRCPVREDVQVKIINPQNPISGTFSLFDQNMTEERFNEIKSDHKCCPEIHPDSIFTYSWLSFLKYKI